MNDWKVKAFLVVQGKESACQGRRHRRPGFDDPLLEEMATHSSVLAWRIPWREKPGGIYSLWGHKS